MNELETKIAALFAKAEATTFPAEAEAFMKKAEELMLKHGIELAQLQANKPGAKREEIVTVRFHIKNGHGYAAAMADIAHAIAPSFSVRSLQTTLGDGGRVIWYIGHKSDVEQAERLAQSLVGQSRTQALHWWKTEGKALMYRATDNDAFLARREFIHAFARGAGARLAETRIRIVEESAPGTGLVLVERGKLVDSWIDENMSVGKGRRTNRRTGGEAARSAGREAGRNAIGNKQLG